MPDRGQSNSDRLYEVVGSAGQTLDVADRDTPPQFYLPGSLTPADVTKWGSGQYFTPIFFLRPVFEYS